VNKCRRFEVLCLWHDHKIKPIERCGQFILVAENMGFAASPLRLCFLVVQTPCSFACLAWFAVERFGSPGLETVLLSQPN
jgi:hypothetical protein